MSPDAIKNENKPQYELSILMPCLNEAQTVGQCIEKAKLFLRESIIEGEIIIADNGSSDGSRQIAERFGAKVVEIPEKGYGNALKGGIAAAKGQYIIMGDADGSYDFSALMPFVKKLREGYDLVMGNRFRGGIKPGAMPALHKYVGNPILSSIGQLFFSSPAKDFHCGLRGFSKKAALQMDLQTNGMEFASEMVIKSSLLGLRVCEVPITLYPDGRDRPPHLRSWRDGWRHLRFMLLFSPRWLFFYPGLILMMIGIILSIWTFISPIRINSIELDIHSLAYFNAGIVIGFSMILFAVQSRFYAYRAGFLPSQPSFQNIFRLFNLERGLLTGAIMILSSLLLTFLAFGNWARAAFGDIDPVVTMRFVIPSVSIIIMGTQVIFSSFFLSMLDIKTSKLDRY